jgi:hypothetical protein
MRIVLTIDVPESAMPAVTEVTGDYAYSNPAEWMQGALLNELADAGAEDVSVEVTSVQ